MEKVVLPEVKATQSLRRKKDNTDNSITVSDAFMQIIDNMIQNMQQDSETENSMQQNMLSIISESGGVLTDKLIGSTFMSGRMESILENFMENQNQQSPLGLTDFINSLKEQGNLQFMQGNLQQDNPLQTQQVANSVLTQQSAVNIPVSGVQTQLSNTNSVVNQIIVNPSEVQAEISDVTQSQTQNNKSFVIENVPVTEAKYTEYATQDVSYKGISVPTIVQNRVIVADKSELMGETPNENASQSKTENKETFNQVLNSNTQVIYETVKPEVKQVDSLAQQNLDLVDQINNGIKDNLQKTNSEFVLKLKPESLGEITLKIVEKSGKMVLDITTASQNTAKLINMDLASLRDAVKPMNVEVHEVTVQVPSSSQGNATHFDMSGQQFANQHGANGNQNFHYNSSQGSVFADDEYVANEAALTQDGLDTYV